LWAAALALFALTLGGLLSVYQTLFAVWMTAYPMVNTVEWRTRLYERFAITIGVGICWIALAIWLYRQSQKSTSQASQSQT